MDLLELPVELLDNIAIETIPESFESFALTCKKTLEVSHRHIAQHNDYKRKYSRIAFGEPSCVEEAADIVKAVTEGTASVFHHSLQFINCIAREPIIARYIEYANLSRDGVFPQLEDHYARLKTKIRADGLVARLL